MTTNPTVNVLRAKKLGILLRDARLAAGKTVGECAQAIGMTESTIEDYELGESAPSLPELELLARFLAVPLDHFWGSRTITRGPSSAEGVNIRQRLLIRQRIIGTLLRQARTAAQIQPGDLAQKTGLSSADLEAYELGDIPIPVPILETLSEAVGRPIRDFYDRVRDEAPGGEQLQPTQPSAALPEAVQDFLALPVELQEFITKPINLPYLELARRLSEMSVEKLRAVAEGLLEITL